MRILHTADWHLGDRLGRIDRTLDIRRSVEAVGRYCDSERADVLIVAGDLFSELARPDGLRDSIQHLQTTFGPFMRRGGTVVAITGNHDNENFCRTLCHAMDLAAPGEIACGTTVAPGRFYLAAEPTLLKLSDADGRPVQFVLMPYPTPSRYLLNAATQAYTSLDQKQQFLKEAFGQTIDRITASADFDAAERSVLVAHGAVLGGPDNVPLFRIDASEDVPLDHSAWAERFDYVALGHIHKPMRIAGHAHIQYSGSAERLDLGESGDQKRAVLIDLGPAGVVGEPKELPLPATPVYEVVIDDPAAELPSLAERYPDRADAIVKLRVTYTSGEGEPLEAVLKSLDGLFPRWYAREWTDRAAVGPAIGGEPNAAQRFDDVVRTYVGDELVEFGEADRQRIFDRLDRLLAASEGGAA